VQPEIGAAVVTEAPERHANSKQVACVYLPYHLNKVADF
jgi:hypothetical protein